MSETNLLSLFRDLDKEACEIEKDLQEIETERDKAIRALDEQFKTAISINPKSKIKSYLESIKDEFSLFVSQAQNKRKKSLQKQFVDVKPYDGNISSNPTIIIKDATDFVRIFNELGYCSVDRENEILQKASDIATRASVYLQDFETLYENFSHQSEYMQNVKIMHNRDEVAVKQNFADHMSELKMRLGEITSGLYEKKQSIESLYENEKISAFNGCSSVYPSTITLGKYEAVKGVAHTVNKVFPEGIEEPFDIGLISDTRNVQDEFMAAEATKCSVLVDWDGEDSREIYSFLKTYLNKIALSFPVGYCQIYLADLNEQLSRIVLPDFYNITAGADNGGDREIITNIYTNADLVKVIKKLDADSKSTGELFGKSSRFFGRHIGCISKYNEIASETPLSAKFLILYNYPKGFDKNIKEQLENLVDKNDRGIYIVVIRNKKYLDESASSNQDLTIDKVFENAFKITIENKCTTVSGRRVFYNLYDVNNENVGKINEVYKKSADNTKTIYLKELFDDIDDKALLEMTKSEEGRVSLPFGKQNTKICSLDFDMNTTPTAIVIGKTRSGKTSLLHSLVLSSAYKYSPDELQFYIMDLKDNADFGKYKTSRIPHVRAVLESDATAAREMLVAIKKEKERRNGIFEKFRKDTGVAEVSNLGQYNYAIEKGIHIEKGYPNYQKIPYLCVIIDEFNVLYNSRNEDNSESQNILTGLMNQIGSAGISIIFAGQQIPNSSTFENVLSQTNKRISLNFGEDINIPKTLFGRFFEQINIDNIIDDNKKGFLYFRRDSVNPPKLCRSALPAVEGNDNGFSYYISAICNKYNEPRYKDMMDRLIISGEAGEFNFSEGYIDYFAEEDIKPAENENIEVPVGISVASGAPTRAEFLSNNRIFYMVGNDAKNKNMESLMLLGLIQKVKYLDSIEYLDFRKDVESHPALDKIFMRFSKYIRVTEPVIKSDISVCYSRLSCLSELMESRMDRTCKPIFVFLSCYDDILSIEENSNIMENESILQMDLSGKSEVEIKRIRSKFKRDNRISKAEKPQQDGNSLKKLIENADRSNMYFIIHIDKVKSFNNAKISSVIGRDLHKAIFTDCRTLLDAKENNINIKSNNEQVMAINPNDDCAVYYDGVHYIRVRRAKFEDNEKFDAWFDDYEKFIERNE